MTDLAISIKGRDEARSRKKQVEKRHSTSSIGSNNVSDSGDSRARSERLAVRTKRVAKAKARKGSGRSNKTTLCLVAAGIFTIYILACLILFRNLPEDGNGTPGARIRGLIKKGQSNNAEQNASPSGIPKGVWPVSIRDEDGKFEEIKHPGFEDGHVTMTVPGFWADDPVALHQNKLMSRERALSVGTCRTPDPNNGSFTRGDACPPNERTVFVAIASYRDWQCRDTVTSIFSAAAHPERIRVGELNCHTFSMRNIFFEEFLQMRHI